MKEYEYVSLELTSPFIIKVFASSQFRYCRLALMFHSKSCNKTNYLRKRVLRKAYCDRSASFQDLLRKNNLVSIHLRNEEALATKIFQVKNNSAPKTTKELFIPKICHMKFVIM